MPGRQFGLIEAQNAVERMGALCQLIEFWLGPRKPEYGEPVEELAKVALPMPLKRLYEFAGRWPSLKGWQSTAWAVPVFCEQDHLLAVANLEINEHGRLVFLHENQCVWKCLTLPLGDDPPVWCVGDQLNEDGKSFTGEKIISESLSCFMVSYVLNEISIGAHLCLADERLTQLFENDWANVTPLWLNGRYAWNRRPSFYVWDEILVADKWSSKEYVFSANKQSSIDYLTQNQGQINEIRVNVGTFRELGEGVWSLDLEMEGSAALEFRDRFTMEKVVVPPGTFDFPFQCDLLTNIKYDRPERKREPWVNYRRKGQHVWSEGRYVPLEVVKPLFQRVLRSATNTTGKLRERFAAKWGQ